MHLFPDFHQSLFKIFKIVMQSFSIDVFHSSITQLSFDFSYKPVGIVDITMTRAARYAPESIFGSAD